MNMPHLEELDLTNSKGYSFGLTNNVTFEGVKAITRHCHQLTALRLSSLGAIQAITQLETMEPFLYEAYALSLL